MPRSRAAWGCEDRPIEMIELDASVAREANSLRRQHRLKLPGAIIWAAARLKESLLLLATREILQSATLESASLIKSEIRGYRPQGALACSSGVLRPRRQIPLPIKEKEFQQLFRLTGQTELIRPDVLVHVEKILWIVFPLDCQ
jgi:hypothetical protein